MRRREIEGVRVDAAGFAELMETIARSWNEGDTSRALECFTNDVVYMEPPDEQLHRGHAELFEFFGGDTPPPMTLVWHHLAYQDPIGVGEYTYRGIRQYHGLVLVRCRVGKIARWREYQRESELDWETFVGPSRFV